MKNRLTLAGLIVLAISGCNGGGSGSSNDASGGPTATQSSTEHFSVSGTSSPLLPTQPQPISPYENDGVFTVDYEIDANGTVDIELSVIEAGQTPLFCGSETTEFYDQDCGEGESCGLSGEISCQFTSHNLISCEGGPITDLTDFFEQLPQEADIVLCVNRHSGGSANVARVEFR